MAREFWSSTEVNKNVNAARLRIPTIEVKQPSTSVRPSPNPSTEIKLHDVIIDAWRTTECDDLAQPFVRKRCGVDYAHNATSLTV